ncbi:hypothetical protein G9A89_007296 [Geosiphon pyriformis]|nr:hypothetical protein G9A89_007296 [Geosiphon pyriformis]
MPREKLTELRFWEAMNKTTIESLTSTNNSIQKWQNQKTIAYLLGTSVNIKSARETFYNELIQNTSLPTNHNFASIITEINKEIEHHTQQKYPITYTNKDKGKLQTPAVTLQRIQPSTWKKTKVESPNNPSYHYTPGSAINISLTDAFTSNMTSIFRHFPFQSKQRKKNLLEPYGNLWEITESEGGQKVKEEKKSEDHKFTYQNPILKNPESETPNFQIQPNLDNQENNTLNIQTLPNQNNPNSEVINQYLPPVIIIDQPPVEPIGQPIQSQNQQQPPPVLPQQQQQLPPPQQQQMAYALITKLDKFNGEEDNAQVWLNDIAKAITANNWDDAKVMQVIPYFLQDTADYFSNNNSINKLANTFTTIKQGDTEAVTIYLRCFHKNLHQIQAIQANYFITPQILNQFIRELHSNILQQVCSMHPMDLPTTVTYARDFEATKLEANHAQAVNLAINGSSELDSKLKQFRKCKLFPKSVMSIVIIQLVMAARNTFPDSELSLESRLIPTYLSAYNTPTNLSTATTSNLSGVATSNISTTATSNLLNTHYSNTTSKSCSDDIRKPQIKSCPKLEIGNSCPPTNPQLINPTIKNPNSQYYLSLLVTPEDVTSSNQGIEQQQPPTNNIPPATITENKSLDAIFPFKLEKPSDMSLFNRAVLEEKPIMAMYTDIKVNGHFIKLILDSVDCTVSARIITTDGATKTPIGEINNFSIEVNGIVVPIKVLVMKATQYQALIGNNWLSKTNTVLDWITQELVLSQNGQHTRVPAMCGHFKVTNTTAPLIDFEKEKPKPIWKTYQLPPILSWDNNGKEKQKRIEPTWNADQAWDTNHDLKKPPIWE